MTAPSALTRNEAEIHALLGTWQDAIARQNIDDIMANRSEDMVAFDVPPPFQFKSSAEYRQQWQDCMKQMGGPFTMTIDELRITASDEVAFCHFIMLGHGDMSDGSSFDCKVRSTMGFKKTAGSWTVTHEHHSMPIQCPAEAECPKAADGAKS